MIKYILMLIFVSSILMAYPLEIDASYYSKNEIDSMKAIFTKKLLKNKCVNNKNSITISEDKRSVTLEVKDPASCRKDRILYSSVVKGKANQVLSSDKLGKLNEKYQEYGENYLKLLKNQNLQLTQITYETISEILIVEETYMYGAKLRFQTKIGKLKSNQEGLTTEITVTPSGRLIKVKFGKIKSSKAVFDRDTINLSNEKYEMDNYIKSSYKNLSGVDYNSKFDYVLEGNKLVLSLLVHLKKKDKEKFISVPYVQFKNR